MLASKSGVDLSCEGTRWRLRHQITTILAPWFAVRTMAEIAEIFDRSGLTWAPFRCMTEALNEDPDLGPENPMFKSMMHPGVGRYPVPGSPVTYSGFERADPKLAPALGAHTEEILSDVARLDETEIAQLFDKGIVAQANTGDSRRAA